VEFQIAQQTLRKKNLSSQKALKRPEGSEEDSSDSDRDEHEATQEQPRSLKRSVRVTVPPTRYSREDDHVSFTLVIKTGDHSSYLEAIKEMTTTSGLQSWNRRWSLWIEIKHEN